MALEDPSTWRLRTNSGIPYKLVSREGSFGGFFDESNLKEEYVFQTSQLLNFAAEMFPVPFDFGDFILQRKGTAPGNPFFFPMRVHWKAHIDGLPIDPFGVDANAPAGTYKDVCRVTVDYRTANEFEEASEPRDFLEISANATGEFIHTDAGGGSWQSRLSANPSLNTAIKEPVVPAHVTAPMIEWTLRWPQVPEVFFQQKQMARLRASLGKVNSVAFSILYNAVPETMLYAGHNYREIYTIRGSNLASIQRQRFIELEMKFVEKFIPDSTLFNGYAGHNHVWRPGIGWRKLLKADGNPLYQSVDFNSLFTVV